MSVILGAMVVLAASLAMARLVAWAGPRSPLLLYFGFLSAVFFSARVGGVVAGESWWWGLLTGSAFIFLSGFTFLYSYTSRSWGIGR